MTFSVDDLQKTIGVLAVTVGGVYLLGGLIVNLHLSRFGISEYRLLRAKYLAVGILYILGIGALLGLIAIFVLLVPVKSLSDLYTRQIISLVSLLSAAAVYYNQRIHQRVRLFWTKILRCREQLALFNTWGLMTLGMWLYPVSIVLSYDWLITKSTDLRHLSILTLLALLEGVGGFAFSTLHFGVQVYANPVPVGPRATEWIGTGKPQKVQFVGKSEDFEIVRQLGIPLETPQRTAELGLLDETEDYYLVVIQTQEGDKAAKISRDLVKGIVYQATVR